MSLSTTPHLRPQLVTLPSPALDGRRIDDTLGALGDSVLVTR